MSNDIQAANEETRRVWNSNSAFWDARMGEGNDFVNLLEWPGILRLLQPGEHQQVLDIATGNGLTARRLAELGASVLAFDFSAKLIELAQGRQNPGNRIKYSVLDATDLTALLALGKHRFDSALCNMGLFDMADIEPLFATLPLLLKPGGCFVFTLTHPAFNNRSSTHVVEEFEDHGEVKTTYSIKVSRYMTISRSYGVAIRDQPEAQIYFDRPIQYYFNLGFRNGFILDGFEETAFPPDHPQANPLSWGGRFSEIPAVMVVRLRLK
jgi:SAM-dependent methyltransferase